MEYYSKFSLVKLKLLLVLFLIIIPLSASNEFVNNVLNNDQMLIVLNKRLGNLNNYHSDASNHDSTGSGSKQTYGSASVIESIDKSSHLSRSSDAFNSYDQAFCERKLRDGVIIKATESIKAGATYIDSIKDVASKEICIQYCCQNTTCDVAVYQDKGDSFCYLFQCDGKCIFKEHAGYYVIDISHKKLEQSEEELHSLNNDLQDLSSSASKEKTFNDQISKKEDAVKTAENKYQEEPKPDDVIPVANFPPTEPVIAPHSVGIKGYCTQSVQCEDPNAACIDHNCYCKMGYYIKDGLCRKVCSASSFECFELGTLSRGPECISRDQVCDSYMHCADGSDEFNCENIDFPPGQRLPKPNTVEKLEVKSVQALSHETGSEGQNLKPIADLTRQPNISTTVIPKTASTTTLRTTTRVKPQSQVTTTGKPSHPRANERVFLSSEKVIIASSSSNAEGPIIALSLGLAFTIILLALVVYRLRRMRHRLKKGRPLHHNEADYLINGMYL